MSSGLSIQRLVVSYGERQAVRDVSLTVDEGEWLGLIGPNGAGKSTILRALAGLVPYSGEIRIGEESLVGIARRRRAQRIALVSQQPDLPEAMTVAEYVLLGRTPYISRFAREGRGDRRVAGAALDRLDLVPLAGRPLGELSGGERQRAVVARALAQEPDVLLLDEPTSSLDVGRQLQVLEIIAALRDGSGLTVVNATHDLTLAAAFCDRVALISHGGLVAFGPVGQVLTEATLSEHYDASFEVLRGADGALAVVARRARPGVSGRVPDSPA